MTDGSKTIICDDNWLIGGSVCYLPVLGLVACRRVITKWYILNYHKASKTSLIIKGPICSKKKMTGVFGNLVAS